MSFKAIAVALAALFCAAGATVAEDRTASEGGPLDLLVPDVLLQDHATPADLAISIVGYQYGWRYDYPDPTRGAAVRCRADALVLPQGKVVELTLTADDVIHEWRVPALGLQSDAIPGLLNVVRVETGKAGAFDGGATSLSGDGYRQMAFELRILTPEAYDAWRQAALTPCRTP